MRAWVLLLVAACNSSSAHPLPPPPPTKLDVVATIPAWDAVAVAGKLMVVDDKFLTVTALDAFTGKRAWTTKVIKEANGRHTLHVVGAAVLAWFGESLSWLEPSTGKVRALGKRGYNGVAWREGGCWIDIADNVCAQRCECSFQLFDCMSNKEIGPRYQKTHMEFHESDMNGNMSSSSGCFGMTEQLFGKAGNLALITVEDNATKGKSHGSGITTGIDLTTGKEAWRLSQSSQFAGHSPDGSTCWFYGFTEGVVTVDCATGKQLWTGSKLASMGQHVVQFVPASGTTKAGIFDLRAPTKAAGEASLHDPRTGATRWTVKLAPNTLAWVYGTMPALDNAASSPATLAILDPATGKTIGSAVSTFVTTDGHGGFLTSDGRFVMAYDATGKRTAVAELHDAVLIAGDKLVVAQLPAEIVALDTGTLRERGRYVGTFNVIKVEGGLGANRITAMVYDGKSIGSVTLLSVR